MIAEPAEEELADHRSRKGDGGDIGSRGGILVFDRIELAQHCADRPNDSVDSSVSMQNPD